MLGIVCNEGGSFVTSPSVAAFTAGDDKVKKPWCDGCADNVGRMISLRNSMSVICTISQDLLAACTKSEKAPGNNK